MLGFEAQTKKLSRWFWDPNHKTRAASFEAQTEKPPPPWFWSSTKKPTASFEVKPGKTVATSFKAKLVKTVASGFEGKPLETVRVVLRSNHSQIVDLGFEAQSRNPRS
jgi:hypothetical protein